MRRLRHLQLMKQEFINLPNTSFHGAQHLWVQWEPSTIKSGQRSAMTFPIGNPDKRKIVRNTKVVSAQLVAEGIKQFVLEADDDVLALPVWAPGAHIELLLPNGLKRKYSL